MRQIVLDTETTGLEADEHNIIEIGCVEMHNRRLTGKTYHQYIKPDREIESQAIRVHGITNEFLDDKPSFPEIKQEFIGFIKGAELIIHNAAFDVGFIDKELERNGSNERVEQICEVTDSLLLARAKHPGQKNNLDALCNRYGINNSHRDLHGALLDAEILAEVYLALTGGQTSLMLSAENEADTHNRLDGESVDNIGLPQVQVDAVEQIEHQKTLERINKNSTNGCLWLQDRDD